MLLKEMALIKMSEDTKEAISRLEKQVKEATYIANFALWAGLVMLLVCFMFTAQTYHFMQRDFKYAFIQLTSVAEALSKQTQNASELISQVHDI